jgi:hypothetical protein
MWTKFSNSLAAGEFEGIKRMTVFAAATKSKLAQSAARRTIDDFRGVQAIFMFT